MSHTSLVRPTSHVRHAKTAVPFDPLPPPESPMLEPPPASRAGGSSRGGWWRAGVLTLVLGLTALLAVGAGSLSAPSGSLAQERSSQEIQRELREAERERDALRGELGEVRGRLEAAEVELAAITVRLEDAQGRRRAAEGQVALGEAALQEAEEEQAAAEAADVRARELLAEAEQQLQDEQDVLADQVVHTFKYGTVGAQRGAMALEMIRRAEDPNAFAVGLRQLQTVVDVQDSTVGRVIELRERREDLADDAARARGRAVQAAVDAADTLEVLEELRAEAVAIAAEVAEEQQAQESLLASLELTEAETADLVAAAAQRTGALEEDLRNQRAREEAQRRAEEEEARRAAAEAEAARRAAQRESSGNGNGSGSGSSGSGRLSTPGAAGGTDVAGVVCPVQGAVAGRDFSNDWGYPRSGGRYHQGNDIFAGTGTPVVAVADGVVTRWNPASAPTALGGITVTYRIGDGSEWYNAHLDAIADGIEPGVSISRGQQIGTVGRTGNARSTPPHLHIGRRQGGSWVNPWPTISPAC